jgi:preprotein translocase SecE subunit
VARNRQRAKERRARQSPPVVGSGGPDELHGAHDDEAPEPLEHAAPDVELAEAQLALGRPDLARDPGQADSYDEAEDVDEELEYEDEVPAAAGGNGQGAGLATLPAGPDGEAARLPAAPPRTGNRLVGFLQGSWRELQRVQWPDRRQVIQATGVVLGFVIVAGVFLGVADFLATKLMNYILTGHS